MPPNSVLVRNCAVFNSCHKFVTRPYLSGNLPEAACRLEGALSCSSFSCFFNVALTLLLPNDSANTTVVLIFDKILVMSSRRFQF